MHIRAIETEYDGCKFRSRTEAKWAVFFNAMGIAYQHEPEGFEMQDGASTIKYLPDFWLPELKCWVEIKPGAPNEREQEKARRLAAGSGFPVYVFFDVPDVPRKHTIASAWKFTGSSFNVCYWWTECPVCKHVAPAMEGCVMHLPCNGCGHAVNEWEAVHGHKSPRLLRAYREAKSARFEGLTPNLRRALERA